MSTTYDTVIVGAGPGGSAAAYFLARYGLKVLLLDKFEFPRDKTCGDGLTPRALRILEEMDLLDSLQVIGFQTRGLEIHAPNGSTVVAPIPTIAGRFGYTLVVPRLILDNITREHALQAGAVFRRAHIQMVEQTPQGVAARGNASTGAVSFRARTAVIATGASVGLLLRIGILKQKPPMMVAARAYFEGMTGLNDHSQFYFDGVPLPGYGWIFPLSGDRANIGTGFFAHSRRKQPFPSSPAQALMALLQAPTMQSMLARARQDGPIKGYPLRVDFAAAPTVSGRALLVARPRGWSTS